jgi:hypothetical protein
VTYDLEKFERAAKVEMDKVYAEMGFTIDRGPGQDGWITHDVEIERHNDDGTPSRFRIEEKFRQKTYPDIAIELMDGAGGRTVRDEQSGHRHNGWLFYVAADWVVYVFCDTHNRPKRSLWLRWPELRRWFWDWCRRNKMPTAAISDKGDKGLAFNITVPIRDLPPNVLAHDRRYEWKNGQIVTRDRTTDYGFDCATPGSRKAYDLGCTCDMLVNAHGRGFFGGAEDIEATEWVVEEGCRLHWPPNRERDLAMLREWRETQTA